MKTVIVALALTVVIGAVSVQADKWAQQSSVPNPVAAVMDELGNCQQELGTLNHARAQILRGELVAPKLVLDEIMKVNPTSAIDAVTLKITADNTLVVSAIEKANPGYSVDPLTLKISAKVDKKAPARGD